MAGKHLEEGYHPTPPQFATTTSTKHHQSHSTTPMEFTIVLTSHTLAEPMQPHILELTLPEDWPQNGLLHILDTNEGLTILPKGTPPLYIMDKEFPTAPLLVIERIYKQHDYTIQALQKLQVAGKRTIIGSRAVLKAGNADLHTLQGVPDVQPCKSNALENYALVWQELPSQPGVKTIKGNLTVKDNEKLDAGTYFVDGNIRFYGGTFGPVTLVAKGNVILHPRKQTFVPAQSNVLLVARGGVYMIGKDCTYHGEICSLDSDIAIHGMRQTFQNGGLSAQNITIKGMGNNFLPGSKQ